MTCADALLARRAWPAVTVASVLVVAGHVGVFFVAAHAVGSTPSARILLPLAVLVLLAAAVPTNIGGWGPREGVAAWAFAAAGLGADRGLATATAFGVLVLIASLPGAVVLARERAGPPSGADRVRTRRRDRSSERTVADRPYTLLSCGMSIDGYVDSTTVQRLSLSNDADFDRVDAVRASCDAILVGARTVRNDNPRLLIRSGDRRRERVAKGLPDGPVKVTVTRHGNLDPAAKFFRTGSAEKLVYCPTDTADATTAAPRLRGDGRRRRAEASCMDRVSRDLSDRGIERLMVEGGGTMHTQFLTADLADELDLVVAPFFVGDSRARRFVDDGRFPWDAHRRAQTGRGAPDRRRRAAALRPVVAVLRD